MDNSVASLEDLDRQITARIVEENAFIAAITNDIGAIIDSLQECSTEIATASEMSPLSDGDRTALNELAAGITTSIDTLNDLRDLSVSDFMETVRQTFNPENIFTGTRRDEGASVPRRALRPLGAPPIRKLSGGWRPSHRGSRRKSHRGSLRKSHRGSRRKSHRGSRRKSNRT